MGYRYLPSNKLYFDLTVFYNDYSNTRSFGTQPVIFNGINFQQDLILSNIAEVETYGAEIALQYKYSKLLRTELTYSYLGYNSHQNQIWGFPEHQVSLRCIYNPIETIDVDLWIRYVDEMMASDLLSSTGWSEMNDYINMDLRLAWRITPKLELAFVGQNLLYSDRVEFVQEAFTLPVEVERSFYVKLTIQF